jgi:anti-sigma B factor antagonist
MLPEIQIHNGVVHVKLSGSIYVETATIMREKLLHQIDKGNKDLVIDFEQVDYIDSSGLGVLISIQKRSLQLGGDIVIKNLKGKVKELFELTRLVKVFKIE